MEGEYFAKIYGRDCTAKESNRAFSGTYPQCYFPAIWVAFIPFSQKRREGSLCVGEVPRVNKTGVSSKSSPEAAAVDGTGGS